MTFFTRLLFALFGMAFAVLFTLGVLCWLALYVTFAGLRWLVTGQKPQVVMMWQQIQAMRKGMQAGQSSSWSHWSHPQDAQRHEMHGPAQQRDSQAHEVEDAVVREIHDKRSHPKD
jgi:hypothetical protein